MKKFNKSSYALLAILGLTFLLYIPSINGFFQQDEWLSFGFRILLERVPFSEILKNIFTPSVGHYQPLTTLVLQTLFSLFHLNFPFYFLTSIFLHLLNIVLVFYLAKEVFKGNFNAYLTALLFGINASGVQATSWVLADVGVHFSTMTAVLSILFFFKFLKGSKQKIFYLCIVFFLISLLFKEITIGLFAVFPLGILIFKGNTEPERKRCIQILIVTGIIYCLFRLSMIFLPQAYSTDTLVVNSQSTNRLIYNFVSLPIKALAQTIVPQQILPEISKFIGEYLPISITGQKDTPSFDMFVFKKVTELVSGILFVFVAIILFLIFRYDLKGRLAKLAYFWLGFVFLNSFIYGLAPERSGIIILVDSRNLYFILIGSVILTIAAIEKFSKGNKIKMAALLIPLLGLNIFYSNKILTATAKEGSSRKAILKTLKNSYPTLPRKVIFYTESDKSFYGLPESERILPFQSGFGQTLLIWYSGIENFPDEFYKGKFLWAITDQGYIESQGRGFGYFRDFDQFAQSFQLNGLALESVIAFQFDSSDDSLKDISNEIRSRLLGFISKKELLSRDEFLVESDQNEREVDLMLDQNLKTIWDSHLPYDHPQSIDIELKIPQPIAQIQLDSGESKDQNKVGFEVQTSKNKKDWKRVFYSKVYPPNGQGKNNIYIEPKEIKFIKILQIGNHPFASWTISELRIFKSN